MIEKIWSKFRGRRRCSATPVPRHSIVMTKQCHDQIVKRLYPGTISVNEAIVYFLGVTTGVTTLAVATVSPESHSTPTSVDVEKFAMMEVIRGAALAGLQVVGQLHTHPMQAYHSRGDLAGMRIRFPGFFSIVVPEYGARLPSLEDAHTMMWTIDGYLEIRQHIRVFDGMCE